MASIGAICIFTYVSRKVAKSMAKHISQLFCKLQPVVCLSREDVAIWRPHEHSWMSDKPEKEATGKAGSVTFSTNTQLIY